MSYAVKLDVFEGPLDLLLQLVSKERLDVADVSISTIGSGSPKIPAQAGPGQVAAARA